MNTIPVNFKDSDNVSIFMWGDVHSEVFTKNLDEIYGNIVYWKKNVFKLPSGSAGKDYIRELSRLINSWTTKSALRPVVVWKSIMMYRGCITIN